MKKENWVKYLFLNIITLGFFTFYAGKKLGVYDKDAWYSSKVLWLVSFLCGIYPGLVLLFVFYIESGCLVCKKLNVPFKDYYSYPYIWILLLIIPILGWVLFIILLIYVHTWYVFYLKEGN